jgi:drug/metabolite transporter (DMT)-like permease
MNPKAPGLAVLAGSLAMCAVGGSTAVSGLLRGAPMFTAQAIRYGLACLLLLAVARLTGRRIRRPRLDELGWLAAVTTSGLLVFNVALVRGAAHAEPAVFGVAVASVPILLAGIGPLLERRRPAARLGLAAVVVTAGAALVEGLGRSDGLGLAYAALTLVCEAGFTLLAVPLLGRGSGPWGISVHTTWMATLAFGVLGAAIEGPAAVFRLTATDWAAIGYLTVIVTAVAFILWYSTVATLGAARAGLLTGIAPLSAAGMGVLLGRPWPSPVVWLGIAVVAAGLTIGLTTRRVRAKAPTAGFTSAIEPTSAL